MNDTYLKESMINTFKELSEKYPERWESSTSKTCFTLMLPKDAFYICTYLDSSGYKNLSIYTIDDDGYLRNNLIISEHDEQELFNSLMVYYEKIKQQVRTNKIENITSLLNN